jgi:NDP-sugar pyrophosphorylase family protein
LSLIDGLDETFMVTNGDLLTDLDFEALVDYHRSQKAILTIATLKRTVKIDLGVIEFDDESVVTRYIEKPEQPHYVSMGVYVYEPAVLRYIQHDRYLDFPDLVVRLLAAKERVCTYVADCTWLDIGRPDDYARAQQIVQDHPDKFNINDFNSAKHAKLRA